VDIGKRARWTPPWDLFKPWQLVVCRTSDEFVHPTLFVKLPFLGALTIWIGRIVNFNRWACIGCTDWGTKNPRYTFISPDDKWYIEVPGWELECFDEVTWTNGFPDPLTNGFVRKCRFVLQDATE